ncbi:MAG: hypothetical protein WC455_17915 [Dehalococcoidia bacterium]|jgi:hypothetical protein
MEVGVKDIIKAAGKPLFRSKAIRLYCHECSGGTSKEVTLCPLLGCPLWPWRFGNAPKSKAFITRMKTQKENTPKEFEDAFSDAVSSPSNEDGLHST